MAPAADPGETTVDCRGCGSGGIEVVLDLGMHVPAGLFPADPREAAGARRFPLRLAVCRTCGLAQLADDGPAETNPPGAVGSVVSPTLRDHQRRFAAEVVDRLHVDPGTVVYETASHGGYLHPWFAELGVATRILERAGAMAGEAAALGWDVRHSALDEAEARRIVATDGPADVIVDNYLLAHLDDPDRHLSSLAALLAPEGTIVVEFDHLLPTILGTQYDAIRHGHFSYLSVTSLAALLAGHGLSLVDVSEQPVYGGAVRAWIRHDPSAVPTTAVDGLIDRERMAGLDQIPTYRTFAERVAISRRHVREFLSDCAARGLIVVGYGAPTRGNTLLAACDVTSEMLPFTVDRSPSKQGRVMAAGAIPIRPASALGEARPRYILVLTWDIASEIVEQLPEVASWGGQFVLPVPDLRILPVPDR